MPVSWRITRGIALLESTETSTFEEWRSAVEGFLADPDYRAGMGVVHDWRSLGTPPSTPDIEARADYLERRTPSLARTRWALVVAGDAASYGMARMGQSLVDHAPVKVAVFRDLEVAEAWVLGSQKA